MKITILMSAMLFAGVAMDIPEHIDPLRPE